MEIQVAVLCDAATDSQGKLNILGTFDTINTVQIPAVHPQCSLALRVTFSKAEEGKHTVKLNLIDEDGKSLMRPLEMPVDVVVPDDSYFVSRNLVVNFQGLSFNKAGPYSIDISMDGRQERSLPLLIKHTPQAPN